MTRRLKRTKDFELSLTITNDDFLRPPREAQRAWLLNRAMKESADELCHLDGLARGFVPGAEAASFADRTQGELADDEIMEDWQIPVMRAMVDAVVKSGDRVLEIGFGRGVAAEFIQERSPAAHTVIECNAAVAERFHRWRAGYADRDIRLVLSRWQDAMAGLEKYDAIFFHTYPLNDEEFVEQVVGGVTFAGHFFDTAAAHLVEGGAFTYLTNEIDSLSRAHQRALLSRFRTVSLGMVRGLAVPADTRDAMWGNSMVVVKATK